MKKITIIFTILFWCFSLHAQQQGKDFYYYQGKKIFVTERNDKILLKLLENTDKQSLWELLQEDESINLNVLDEQKLHLHVVLDAKEGKNFSLETLNKFKENSSVKSAQLMLEYENNLLIGLIDEFIVKLKPTTTFLQLQSLVDEYDCIVVRANQFVENQYVISCI